MLLLGLDPGSNQTVETCTDALEHIPATNVCILVPNDDKSDFLQTSSQLAEVPCSTSELLEAAQSVKHEILTPVEKQEDDSILIQELRSSEAFLKHQLEQMTLSKKLVDVTNNDLQGEKQSLTEQLKQAQQLVEAVRAERDIVNLQLQRSIKAKESSDAEAARLESKWQICCKEQKELEAEYQERLRGEQEESSGIVNQLLSQIDSITQEASNLRVQAEHIKAKEEQSLLAVKELEEQGKSREERLEYQKEELRQQAEAAKAAEDKLTEEQNDLRAQVEKKANECCELRSHLEECGAMLRTAQGEVAKLRKSKKKAADEYKIMLEQHPLELHDAEQKFKIEHSKTIESKDRSIAALKRKEIELKKALKMCHCHGLTLVK
jgi:DNA repair exonuclease SbcCD ATPase subunit